MSDEKPAEMPKPDKESAAPEAPASGAPGKTGTDIGAPPTRDEALNRLRAEAAELHTARFGKIISEGLQRLDGVRTVNVFQGEFSVGGDFVSGGPSRARTSRRPAKKRIEVTELDQEHFVRPAGFEEGVDKLADTNMIVLSGQARTGKRSRALATVLEVLQRNELPPQVFELNRAVLGNMSWRVPEPRCGLLVEDTPNQQGKCAAESLGDSWLSYASKQLADQGSFLVVVTGPVQASLAAASKRKEHLLEDLELPDPLEIVRRRVAGALPWLVDLDDMLAKTELAELLAERDNPQFATRVAAEVVRALSDGDDLGPAVAKLRDTEEHVREWLEGDPDLAEVALVVATAVLEGASYLNVADAAVTLYRALGGGSATLTPRYLRRILAEYGWIECLGRPGDPHGAPMLRFRNARLRPVVLGLAWFELDGARAKILTWLEDLAEHTDVEVRARAAQAAGILASSDFEHGVHTYLLPWGGSRSAPLRQSAAQGLNMAGTIGEHADSAWSYVEQWAELASSPNVPNLPATAGLAAGGPLGVQDPRRALRVLRMLVCDGNWGLLEPAALSTQMLLEAGRTEEVLDALLEWTTPVIADEPEVKALTMFAFTALPERDAATQWPLLMRSAERHPDTLPELWGRALSCEPVRPLAMDALRAWVRVADADSSARHVVLVMIAGIADRGDDDYSRLCHVLREWADDRDDPSDAAADFHNELLEAREEAS